MTGAPETWRQSPGGALGRDDAEPPTEEDRRRMADAARRREDAPEPSRVTRRG